MCQKRDRLKGVDNFYFGIQSWIQIRQSLMNVPTTFQWVHLWPEEEFKVLRGKCCLHFGLDWSKKEERGDIMDPLLQDYSTISYIFSCSLA
jgi:hypothetical protein